MMPWRWLSRALAIPLLVLAGTGSHALPMSAAGLGATVAPASKPVSVQMDTFLSKLVKRHLFGGVVLVGRRGRILLNKGYSLADGLRRVRNTPNTIYPLFGVTGGMLAVATLRLQEKGRLRVGNRICIYLPRCPAQWKSMTIYQLLTHTSGLPDFDWTTSSRRGASPARSVGVCQTLPRFSASIGKRSYSECNTLLLSAIIERVARRLWERFMRDTIFRPSHMAHAGRVTNALNPPRRARGHEEIDLADYEDFSASYMASSTAGDVYRYDQALMAGKLMSRRSLRALFAPRGRLSDVGLPNVRPAWYGYLWNLGTLRHRQVMLTEGSSAGFAIYNVLLPSSGVTVIVLANQGSAVEAVAAELIKLAVGK